MIMYVSYRLPLPLFMAMRKHVMCLEKPVETTTTPPCKKK